jgi:hypothetical protein
MFGLYVCLPKTEIIFVRIEIFVLIFASCWPFFNCQIWVSYTHPKSDGYGYEYEFLPVSTGMNFYP